MGSAPGVLTDTMTSDMIVDSLPGSRFGLGSRRGII